MSDQHTPAPWDQTVEAVVTADGSIIAEINNSEFPGDVDDANLRRIVAAVNATASFTTAGLEQIAAGGYSERLALLASLMMEEVKAKADDAEINRRLRQLTDATGITNDEQADAEAFRGSRGD